MRPLHFARGAGGRGPIWPTLRLPPSSPGLAVGIPALLEGPAARARARARAWE